jgi:hypothetical protein
MLNFNKCNMCEKYIGGRYEYCYNCNIIKKKEREDENIEVEYHRCLLASNDVYEDICYTIHKHRMELFRSRKENKIISYSLD